MARLSGKVALITGAAIGIGRAAAALFAREGAKVLVADIDERNGQESAALARAAGGEAAFLRTDVTEPDSVRAAVEHAAARWGKLDVLYNNAGGSTPADGPAPEVSLDEFWRAIKLDLYGTFLGCRFGIPAIVRSGGGAVVNTTSIMALMGWPNRDAYTAAKGGVASLTRSLAVRYAKEGVRVNAVAPSVTLTPRVEKLLALAPDVGRSAEQHLLGLCQPEDVARAALYLASDESARTTGHILTVDSGLMVS